jgi:uncharacterized protein
VDTPAPAPTVNERVVALLEVLLCSDYPTQIALEGTFAAFGLAPRGAALGLGYVAALSLSDTVLLILLILLLLRSHGERPRELFLGDRPVGPEIRAGIPLLFVAFGIAVAVLLTTQLVAPWLHTVARNPLQDLARTPAQAVLFAVVLIVAGGVREEVQRAFLLRRFEVWLGGPKVGLIVTSVGFGAGHFIQGLDAVVATAVLGAFWGVVYLRRRSIVAPAVSHAGFNVVQVLQFVTLGR